MVESSVPDAEAAHRAEQTRLDDELRKDRLAETGREVFHTVHALHPLIKPVAITVGAIFATGGLAGVLKAFGL